MLSNAYVRIALVIVLAIVLYWLVVQLTRSMAGNEAQPGAPAATSSSNPALPEQQ